ncbi:MAG: TolC family protein [Muribaculaceae bacterium]|nr:TolC family protein [Muribaculaceae bacterium]
MINRFSVITWLILGIWLPMKAQSSLTETLFTEVTVTDVNPGLGSQTLRPLTYSQCVEQAVTNNPDIRQTILSILLADQDILLAKDEWLPSVDFSTSHNFTNYPSPGDSRDANTYGSSYGVNASWTVWEGNVRKYRLESARILRMQQQLAGADQIKELQVAILQAYLNILYAREAIDIARQTLEVSTAQTERARRLVEAGRSSKVDLAQIESQRAQDEYSVIQAESSLASYKMTLKRLLALRLDSEVEVEGAEFSDTDILSPLPDAENTFLAAAAWLPEIKSNQLNREIYDNDLKIARAGRLPEISLQGGLGTGYTTGGPPWPAQMGHGFNEHVGVTLSVPIFDANRTRRAVAKANLNALEYDVNQDRLLNDLSQTIEDLYIQARNARAKYTSGIARLGAANQTATLVNRQFELGLVNPLELLTAHNNLLNARLEQLQNKYMAILASKTIGFYASREVNIP